MRVYKYGRERKRRRNSDGDNDEESRGVEDELERRIRQLVADKHTGWPLILLK